MSIAGAMFNAKTALDAFGESMGVIGHNIANLNTVGFKSSRTDFADILPTIMGELETGSWCTCERCQWALSARRH